MKTSEEVNVARLRRRQQDKINGNNTQSTSDARANSPPNSVTSIAEQTECVRVLRYLFVIATLIFHSSNQESSKINCKKKKKKNKNAQSTVDTDDSKDDVLNNNQSDDKCPVCFMIFPLNMTHDNRGQHVNEHYTDD